jgi:hypothetical protein
VHIFQNNITNNTWGINLTSSWIPCENNNISQNNINGNTHGIFMFAEFKGNSIGRNSIFRNNIMNNKEGIYIGRVIGGMANYNTIYQNNFMGNNQAVNLENSFRNHWVGNYWGDAKQLPHPIIGKLLIWKFSFPWIVFDWRPAQEPYDIPGIN